MTAYEIITKKRDGLELSGDEIRFFILGFTRGDIPDYQMSALLMAIYLNGMTTEETHLLVQTMLNSGTVIQLDKIPGVKVDKHSTGGVGDKVSIILAPIVAAAGVTVPMISGRGLGHSGGTLDKLESIPGFRVDYSIDEFRRIIQKTGICLIGQTHDLAPADKKMYALRDVTATIQSIPLICASIMSKKLAEGIDALVLDVKTGHGAFMREPQQARRLAQSLIDIGEKAGKKVIAYITDMNQPLGYSVGNWLEIAECIDCLRGKDIPDLMEVTHQLCGTMIYLGQKAESIEQGIELSGEMIDSGKAWQKFVQIVESQKGDSSVINSPENYPASKYRREISADDNGWIAAIDALEVGLSAILLGAGRQKSTDVIDPKAGLLLHKKTGEEVRKGDPVMTILTDRENVIDAVSERLKQAVSISAGQVSKPQMIIEQLGV